MEEIIREISVSQACVDKKYRLYSTIKRRINGLIWQSESILKQHYNWDEIKFEEHIEALRILIYRLDRYSVITNKEYASIYRDFQKFPKKLEDHSKELLGFYIPRKDRSERNLKELREKTDMSDPNQVKKLKFEEFTFNCIEKFKRKWRTDCIEARANELLLRLAYELLTRNKEGWFVVFNTLTVSDYNLRRVFEKGSRIFSNYISKIDRDVGRKIYGKWKKAKEARKRGDIWHTYFSVIERGKEAGRKHIHVIHVLKKLPSGCYDPNRGLNTPRYREISRFKRYWAYGHSMPIAVRFSYNDAYGKINWTWPCQYDKKEERFVPLLTKSPFALANYMSKYVVKEYTKKLNERSVTWRTKMSRTLGKKVILLILERMTLEQRKLMTIMETQRLIKIADRAIPVQALKMMATKMNFSQMKEEELWDLVRKLEPRQSLLKHVKNMIQKGQNLKLQNAGDLKILDLLEKEGYDIVNLVKKVEQETFGKIDDKFKFYGSCEVSI